MPQVRLILADFDLEIEVPKDLINDTKKGISDLLHAALDDKFSLRKIAFISLNAVESLIQEYSASDC